MRVAIDTTFARRGPSGTGVYLRELVPALRELGVEVVELANPRRRPPAGGGLGSLRNAAEDRRWTAWELPRRARAAGAEVLHHPLPALARRAAAGGPAQAVTVHDLAFERLPGAFDPRFRAFARRAHRAAARGASAVVCVSVTTARDAQALWGVRRERIVVAPHGPGQRLPRPIAPPRRPRHFLYVGDDEPRKNLPALLAGYDLYRAAAPDPAPLVLAGSVEAPRPPGVHLEPSPAPERLAELYAAAIALVHPARHEGFGLTPLEAMAAGTPVLAARSPGLVETCAGAPLWFDPGDPTALAAALRRAAEDPELRADLAARGRARAADFSWERCARSHLDAYTLALGR